MSAAVAITAITTVLNGKSTALRNPNAAPLFRTWVKSPSPGTVVGRRPQLHVRDDEDHRQLLRVRLELRKLRRGRRHDDLRLQRAPDSLVLPQRFDLGEHLHAQIGKTLPARDEIGAGEGVELGRR